MKLYHQTNFNEGYRIETHENNNNPIKLHYSKDNWKTKKYIYIDSKECNLWNIPEFHIGTIYLFFEEILPDGTSHFSHPFNTFDVFSRTRGFWIWYYQNYPENEEEKIIQINLKIFPNWGKTLLYSLSKDGVYFSKKSSIGNFKPTYKNKIYMQHINLEGDNTINLQSIYSQYNYIAFESVKQINDKNIDNKIILKTPVNNTKINPLPPIITYVEYNQYIIERKVVENRLLFDTDAPWTLAWLFYRGGKNYQSLLLDRLNYIQNPDSDFQRWITHKNVFPCLNPGIAIIDTDDTNEFSMSSFVKHIPLSIQYIHTGSNVTTQEMKILPPKYIILIVHYYPNETIKLHLIASEYSSNNDIVLNPHKFVQLKDSLHCFIFKLPNTINESIVGIRWIKKGDFGFYECPEDKQYISITNDEELNHYNLLLL